MNLLVLHTPTLCAEETTNLEYFRERLLVKSRLCDIANFELLSYDDFFLFYNGFECRGNGYEPRVAKKTDSASSTTAESEVESQSLSGSLVSGFVETAPQTSSSSGEEADSTEEKDSTADNIDKEPEEIVIKTKKISEQEFTGQSLCSYSGILAMDFDSPNNRLAEGVTSVMATVIASVVPNFAQKDDKEKKTLLKSLKTFPDLLKEYVEKDGGLLFMDGSSGRRSFDFAQDQFQLSWFSGVVPDTSSSLPDSSATTSGSGMMEVNLSNPHIEAMLPDATSWLEAFGISGGSYLAGANDQEAVISLKGTASLCEMALKPIENGVFAMFQGPCTERWVKMFLQLSIGVGSSAMQKMMSPTKRREKKSASPQRQSSGLLKVTPIKANVQDSILDSVTKSIGTLSIEKNSSAKKASSTKKSDRKVPLWANIKVSCPGLLEFENLNRN